MVSMVTPEPSLVGKLVLASFAGYEAFSAVILLGPEAWAIGAAKRLYKLDLAGELDPKYLFVNRMLGLHCGTLALACVLGLAAGGTAASVVLVALAAISAGRALVRWRFRDLLFRAFRVAPERSQRKALFNLALVVIIVLLSFSRS
jgi:hypothetical protein